MGLISKVISTAARNSTIKAVGQTAINVISAAKTKTDSCNHNHITATRNAIDYYEEYVMDVVRELLGARFENITLKSANKLNERSKNKYGLIESISIAGKYDFSKQTKFAKSSHIVIEFLDFKSKVNQNIYSSVTRIPNGAITIQSNETESYTTLKTSTCRPNKFCPYCGESITIDNAKFCSNCGESI